MLIGDKGPIDAINDAPKRLTNHRGVQPAYRVGARAGGFARAGDDGALGRIE